MRTRKSLAVLLAVMLVAVLLAAPTTALAQQDQAAQVAQQPGDRLGKATGKLEKLGESLTSLMLVVAAIVLMFSARHGRNLLIWVLAGAFLVLGGWKFLVELLKFMLD